MEAITKGKTWNTIGEVRYWFRAGLTYKEFRTEAGRDRAAARHQDRG